MKQAALVVIASLMSVVAEAQWLKQPTVGLPRNADGSPNLAAPAHACLTASPICRGSGGSILGAYGGNIVADLKPQEIEPSADALYKQRMDDFGDDMKAVRRTTDKP
ncbi:MAG TPA: hypothetical protein VKE96_23365 [Vicinamibacterales bacterium]|nr:hypothetical protein [Vicinamibacterales bacterium]